MRIRRTSPADEAQITLELALPLLEDAAGAPVEGVIGVSNPVDAVADAVNTRGFDEVIISTLPQARVASGCTWICRTRSRGSGCR